jgi:hypothetical protein
VASAIALNTSATRCFRSGKLVVLRFAASVESKGCWEK